MEGPLKYIGIGCIILLCSCSYSVAEVNGHSEEEIKAYVQYYIPGPRISVSTRILIYPVRSCKSCIEKLRVEIEKSAPKTTFLINTYEPKIIESMLREVAAGKYIVYDTLYARDRPPLIIPEKPIVIYRFRKGLGFAKPFHASIYSTRSGLESQSTSLSV